MTSAAIRALTLTPKTSTVAKGLTQSYKATAAFTDGTTQDVTATTSWSIKDTSGTGVAVISSRGVVTTKNIGKARITAKYMTLSDTAALEVTAPKPTAISISPSNPTLPKGTAQTFTAKALFSDGSTQDVSDVADWSVTDLIGSGVASIDGVGNVLAEAEGQATVAAEYAGISGETLLQVSAAIPVSVSLSPSSASIAKGLTQTPDRHRALVRWQQLECQQARFLDSDRSHGQRGGVGGCKWPGAGHLPGLGNHQLRLSRSVGHGLGGRDGGRLFQGSRSRQAGQPAARSLSAFAGRRDLPDGSTQAVSSGVTWTATDVMGTSVPALHRWARGGQQPGRGASSSPVRRQVGHGHGDRNGSGPRSHRSVPAAPGA